MKNKIKGLELMILLTGITYTDISNQLGVSRQMVCMWAKERKIPSNREEEIAEILGCSVEYLSAEINVGDLVKDLDRYID